MNKHRNYVIMILYTLALINVHAQISNTQSRYEQAYQEIADMLDGKIDHSVKRAVFLAEWAFLDGNLNYEMDFCEPLARGADYLRRMIMANNWEKYKTSKQIALCNFFFFPCSGNGQKPFEYDFSNEYPNDDWHYQLVSRTINTHKGQCHSLPWTFKLYAEELGARVYLVHAPRHCFIMYKDEDDLFPEDWVNVELTTHQYVPAWGVKEHYAISDSAIIAGTYLTPITDIQTIACQLSDLALGYYHKFHRYDEFMFKCVTKSLQFYHANPSAIIIKARTIETVLQNHLLQNGGLRDAFTDSMDCKLLECQKQLQATHWTQDTDELRRKWNKTPEEIEEIKKNTMIIK